MIRFEYRLIIPSKLKKVKMVTREAMSWYTTLIVRVVEMHWSKIAATHYQVSWDFQTKVEQSKRWLSNRCYLTGVWTEKEIFGSP